MIDVIQIFLQLGGIIIVIALVNYYLIIPTVIIGIIFYYLRAYYLSASRNIKRIEATSKYQSLQFLIIHFNDLPSNFVSPMRVQSLFQLVLRSIRI